MKTPNARLVSAESTRFAVSAIDGIAHPDDMRDGWCSCYGQKSLCSRRRFYAGPIHMSERFARPRQCGFPMLMTWFLSEGHRGQGVSLRSGVRMKRARRPRYWLSMNKCGRRVSNDRISPHKKEFCLRRRQRFKFHRDAISKAAGLAADHPTDRIPSAAKSLGWKRNRQALAAHQRRFGAGGASADGNIAKRERQSRNPQCRE